MNDKPLNSRLSGVQHIEVTLGLGLQTCEILTFEDAVELLQSKRETIAQELSMLENPSNPPESRPRKSVEKQILEYSQTQKITVRLYDDLFYRFLLKLNFSEEKAKIKIAIKNHKFIMGRNGIYIIITLFCLFTLGTITQISPIFDISISAISIFPLLSFVLTIQFELFRALRKVPVYSTYSAQRAHI